MRQPLLPLLITTWIMSTVLHAAPTNSTPASQTAANQAVDKKVNAALDQRVDVVLADMVKALAGQEYWRGIRYLRFDFSLEKNSRRAMWNQHLWDRQTGDNRIEWRNNANAPVVVVYNINTKKGRAWVGTFEKVGADLEALIKEAHARHLQDVFWLGAPFMLADNRSTKTHQGSMTVEGQDYDVIQAQFAGFGLPANDQYWFFINKGTHQVDRWAYFLGTFEGTPALATAWAWRWRNWQNVGAGLIVSTERIRVDNDFKVTFPVIEVLDGVGVPNGIFADVNVSLPAASSGSPY